MSSIKNLLKDIDSLQKQLKIELVKRWDKTGLLDDLSQDDKEKCSLILNVSAEKILEMDPQPIEDGEPSSWHTFTFPVIRKIYGEIGPNIDVDGLLDRMKNTWKMPDELLPGIDWETELCSIIADTYINEYRRKK